MAKRKSCIVEGCKNYAHARGYCRKHYGQIWRKGRINSEVVAEDEDKDELFGSDDSDRMRALERELKKAEHMYRNVVGFEGRLKWRKEMEAVRKEIERLTQPEAATVAGG
ncbi:MAG: hypothetical protein ACYTGH_11005 [Planctomycetota bacterium]|jgi:hypothetical protein